MVSETFMNEPGIRLENAFEELLRRVIRQEIQAAMGQNGHHEGDHLLDAVEATEQESIRAVVGRMIAP